MERDYRAVVQIARVLFKYRRYHSASSPTPDSKLFYFMSLINHYICFTWSRFKSLSVRAYDSNLPSLQRPVTFQKSRERSSRKSSARSTFWSQATYHFLKTVCHVCVHWIKTSAYDCLLIRFSQHNKNTFVQILSTYYFAIRLLPIPR